MMMEKKSCTMEIDKVMFIHNSIENNTTHIIP